jgi:membrane protein implicated in regulation of membrane protease activity
MLVAVGALVAMAAAIVALVAISSSLVADAVAIALMLLALVALSRYVRRIAGTRRSPSSERTRGGERRAERRRGAPGQTSDGEAHRELSPHDVPEDNPARRELERRRRVA